jgi:hypothetical protein
MVAPLGKTLPLLGNSRLAICDSITPASRWRRALEMADKRCPLALYCDGSGHVHAPRLK